MFFDIIFYSILFLILSSFTSTEKKKKMAAIGRLSRAQSQMTIGGPEPEDHHEKKIHKVENLSNATLINPEQLAAMVKNLSIE